MALSVPVVCNVAKGVEASGSNAPDRQMSVVTVVSSVVAPLTPLSSGSRRLLCRAGTASFSERFPKLLHGSSRCPLGAISSSKETVPGDSDLSKS